MNPKHFLRICIFLLFTPITFFQISAQSLHEIKFTDKKEISYTCLLVFFNETNAYMRVAYTDSNVNIIVNVTYKMENGINADGGKYSVLKGSGPVFISNNKLSRTYNPDYFIWFYDYTTKKWKSPQTTDDTLLNPSSYRPVESCVMLDPKKITDQYLQRFFKNSESEYLSLKKMCGLTPLDLKGFDWPKTTVLHFVLIANTLDPSIGLACASDQLNLTNEFRQIANALDVGFREYIVFGDNFSKEKTLSSLNLLAAGSNDIIVFIYRGHGFRWKNQADDWPRLDLRNSSFPTNTENNSINLSEVNNIIAAKGARLNIVLGDCCNNEINQSPVTGSNYMSFQTDNNSDLSRLRKLFMNSKGTILSASAQKGEFSWNSLQGGLYSISFLQSLREEISYLNIGSASWDNVLTKTINLAYIKSTREYCFNCSLQNGIKYISIVNNE